MKRLFARLPIRLKLTVMILVVSAAVLVLASIGYLINDYVRARVDLQSDVAATADLVLKNSVTALQFDDRATAVDTLETLGGVQTLRLACLYDERMQLFADYHPRDQGACPATPPGDGQRFGSNVLEVTSTGTIDGRRYGTVLLRSDLSELTGRVRVQLGIVALLLLVAIVVAIVMSSGLQSVVSEPITALARTAGEVSRGGDYSLRAKRTTEDELGLLVDAFNRMLERIQERDLELSRANDELRREIAERQRAEHERAQMLVREREANRLKDEFLATLSHELRTPLNAILGWVKLLRASAVPPGGIDRALEKVERNAQMQTRLIEDLLEISRIATGKLRLEYRPVDLVAVSQTAIDSIRPTAEARGVRILREFPGTTMTTAGDPDRLQQVIWNLLSNAVKFTPAGGTVTLALRRAGDRDEIVVRDTGIGIDPAFLPSVFETFRQADASSTRVHGGLGLGLSIVKQLVDLHGGEVTAASDGPGAGATFTVRLPVRLGDRRKGDDSPSGRVDVGHRLRDRTVLVVDDDADTRELLVSVLESAGARVQAAASAAEALLLAADAPPEILVSDIAMPHEDGYMLLAQLGGALGDRMPRVRVALSAFAGPHDHERSLTAGFQRHIPKPVDPATLVDALADLAASHPALS